MTSGRMGRYEVLTWEGEGDRVGSKAWRVNGMEETVQVVVERLPTWYLMFVAPVLAWFVVTHVKRDKGGKWYWYSSQYEREKQLRKMDKVLMELQTSEKSQSLVVNKINEQMNENQLDKERLGGAFVEMMKKVDLLVEQVKRTEDVMYDSIRERHKNDGELGDRLKKLDNDLGLLGDSCRLRELEVLKQSVFLSEMPVEERIYSGLRYIGLGGNSITMKRLIGTVRENMGIWAAVKVACKDMEKEIKLIEEEMGK